MKKLLALVLALVMTMGLCTVGTSAAPLNYADRNDIDNAEAVDILSSIGVFASMEDNKFNPTGTFTRAQSAAVIARMYLGGTVADNLTGNGDIFEDVGLDNGQMQWFAGYVEYLAKQGVIGGMGKGASGKDIFNPNQKLTVYQFAKMLLVTLGYDAEKEGLNGNDWQINTAKLAQQIGLFKGLSETVGSADALRQEAAQMAFNALKTPMVEYDATDKLVYKTSAARDTQTISFATLNDGSARGTYLVEYGEYRFPNLRRNSVTQHDDWGRPSTTWTLNGNETLGTYRNTDALVAIWTPEEGYVTGKKIYEALAGSTLLNITSNIQNAQFGGADIYDIFIDGVQMGVNDAWNDSARTATAGGATYTAIANQIRTQSTDTDIAAMDNITGLGRQLEVYVDYDQYVIGNNAAATIAPKVTLVTVNTWLAELLDDASETSVRVNLYNSRNPYGVIKTATKSKFEDQFVLDSKLGKDLKEYKKGDFFVVTYNEEEEEIREVTEAVAIKNVGITAYTNNTDWNQLWNITAGSSMKVARTAKYEQQIVNTRNNNLPNVNGYTYNIYRAGEDARVMGIAQATYTNNLIFVTAISDDSPLTGGNTFRANVIYGTNGQMRSNVLVTASTSNGNALTFLRNRAQFGVLDPAVNTWFTYSADANGNITLLNRVAYAGEPATDGKYFQSAQGMNNGFVTTTGARIPAISSSSAQLRDTTNNRVVVGNDNSIYISAAASTANNTQPFGTISGVNGITTGIRNVNIYVDENNWPNFVGNNVWFVYDNNGYTVAAVAATDGARTIATNTVFIYNTASKTASFVAGVGTIREYDALANGTKATVKLNDNAGVFPERGLYSVTYDANGYVNSWTELLNNAQDAETVQNGSRKFAVLKVDDVNVDSITLGDTVLRTNTNAIQALKNDPVTGLNSTVGYINAATTNGQFYVVKGVTSDGLKGPYATLQQAYEFAVQPDGGVQYYVGEVYANCEGTGYANSMVLVAYQNTGASAANLLNVAKQRALNAIDVEEQRYKVELPAELGLGTWTEAQTDALAGFATAGRRAVNAAGDAATAAAQRDLAIANMSGYVDDIFNEDAEEIAAIMKGAATLLAQPALSDTDLDILSFYGDELYDSLAARTGASNVTGIADDLYAVYINDTAENEQKAKDDILAYVDELLATPTILTDDQKADLQAAKDALENAAAEPVTEIVINDGEEHSLADYTIAETGLTKVEITNGTLKVPANTTLTIDSVTVKKDTAAEKAALVFETGSTSAVKDVYVTNGGTLTLDKTMTLSVPMVVHYDNENTVNIELGDQAVTLKDDAV